MITRFQGGPLDGEDIDTGDAETWVGVEPIEATLYYNPKISPPIPQVRNTTYTRRHRIHPSGRIESIFCLVGEEPSW